MNENYELLLAHDRKVIVRVLLSRLKDFVTYRNLYFLSVLGKLWRKISST